MRLIPILKEILTEGLLDTFIEKNVGDNKPIPYDVFDDIKSASNNNQNYIIWLSKNVINKSILPEDIYKFGDYFKIFENNKSKFKIKDILQHKDVNQFINAVTTIRDNQLKISSNTIDDNEKYISLKNIEKLDSADIKYIGLIDNYQIFHIPNETKDNSRAFNYYREILGKSSGGAIDICTFNKKNFIKYLTKKDMFHDYRGSSYYVLYNFKDPQSPYQIHLESKQFRDRNNKQVEPTRFISHMNHIEEKMDMEKNHIIKTIFGLNPIDGDVENEKLQGTWVKKIKKDDTTYMEKATYENGMKNGPFLSLYQNGNIHQKGEYANDKLNGKIETYNKNGTLDNVTEYSNGMKNGISITYYRNKPTSKYTYENDRKNGPYELIGDDITIGNYSNDKLSGPFIKKDKKGNIYLKGQYKDGSLSGIAIQYHSNGKPYIEKNHDDGSIRIYDENGNLTYESNP